MGTKRRAPLSPFPLALSHKAPDQNIPNKENKEQTPKTLESQTIAFVGRKPREPSMQNRCGSDAMAMAPAPAPASQRKVPQKIIRCGINK